MSMGMRCGGLQSGAGGQPRRGGRFFGPPESRRAGRTQGAARPDDPAHRRLLPALSRRAWSRCWRRSSSPASSVSINPYLLKLLIDEALPQRDFGLLNLFVGLMIAVPIISGLIGVGQSYLNNVIGQRVMQDLRNALYEHLQRLPLRFFTETRTGEIQSRLANDVGGIQSVVTDTASSVFANLVIVFSTVGAMLLLDWRLTALSLGMLPFFLFLTYRVGKIRRRLATMTQASLADMSAITEETVSVSGMLLTKTFGQQEQTVGRFRDASARLARLQIRQSMVGRWFFMIVGTVFCITPAFVYWLAGWLAINGDPTAPSIGDIVAFTTLQSRLFFPLGQLLNVQVELQGALALFDRIFEYLDLPTEIADAPDAVALDAEHVQGRIRFDHVSFRYRGSAPVAGGEQPPIGRSDPTSADFSRLSRLSRLDRRAGFLPPNAFLSASRTSISRRRRGSWSRWSGRPGRARRRRRISSRGCTTSMRARSRSTASTCASCASRIWADSSGS